MKGLGLLASTSARQLTLRCHQVAKPQQQRQSLRVLRQSPVAHFPIIEYPLHLQKGMLHTRSQSGAGSWPSPTPSPSQPPPPRSQAPVSGVFRVSSPPASPPDTPGFPPACALPGTRRRTTPPFPHRLPTVQQIVGLGDVMDVGRRGAHAVHQTHVRVHPDVNFHRKNRRTTIG